MDLILFILIAAVIGLLAWAITTAAVGAAVDTRRKLHDRLSTDLRLDSAAGGARPLVLAAAPHIPRALGRVPLLVKLQRRLLQASPHLTLTRFLLATLTSGAAVCAIGGVIGGALLAAVGAAAGAYVPWFLVSVRRARRRSQLTGQLPEALDFLCRALRAGQSFSSGLQMMAEELPPPLSLEFRRCYDQHTLGQPLEDGLREAANRLELDEFAFFATAVVIQRQSGGDMAEVLGNISRMIRHRLRLQQSVRAKTSEGRFTGYVMFLFPMAMFCITWVMDPERGNVMLYTGAGRWLLGIAIGLQVIGLLLIRRITTVRV